ncbi:MAG: hypothetical protein JSV89_06440 [Spirochaetaceae bacterium]|nr:MAG: hypothetical protein JSV89_06440 [Spirochaetaceae bacterium]
MNRWLHCWIILILIFMACGSSLFGDIDQSVLDLLTGLSCDYAEYREEVFFKVPLTVAPFVDSGPLAKDHEIGAVVDGLIRGAIINSTYFILKERENLSEILEEICLSQLHPTCPERQGFWYALANSWLATILADNY